ncbi:MAG: DUF1844 domain-containing protein [Thermoleophilaceae bacterium]
MHEPPPPQGEPTEEELRAALDEQMSRLRVEDVVLQTVATLVNLAARRLGLTAEPGQEAAERDLDQARMGIDAVRALMPLTPEEQAEPIRQALSQLQMAFAQLSAPSAAAGPGVDVSPPPPPSPSPAEASKADDGEAERAKARAKIWTPPGA